MKTKTILAIILILLIIYNFMFKNIEGLCSYVDKGATLKSKDAKEKESDTSDDINIDDINIDKILSGETSFPLDSAEPSYGSYNKGAPSNIIPSTSTCDNVSIYENQNRSKEAEDKLNELKRIVAKTQKNIMKNFYTNINNFKNVLSLEKAARGEDEDTGKACEKHPEACGSDPTAAAVSNAQKAAAVNYQLRWD